MGYALYGGLTNWTYSGISFKSASPVKTATAKPTWALASDLVINMATLPTQIWGDPTKLPNDGLTALPAHKKGNTVGGGNQLFADGSVSWIKAGAMYNLYSANGNSRNFYWYQDDLGAMTAFASSLSKGPQ
jgi:prepilin-type processing-associated H-X9-DG protein